jgi:hypothetical protein
MKLNIYKNQKQIEKTYEVDEYDIMYGTVEDVFEILDGMESLKTDGEILSLVQRNRKKLNDLLLDIFCDEGLTEEELRRIKLKELVPLFLDLFKYVRSSFGAEKN